MNTAIALADTLSAVAVTNRNPTLNEYKNGSPAERRAIVARWEEIVWGGEQPLATGFPNTSEGAIAYLKNEDRRAEIKLAYARLCEATAPRHFDFTNEKDEFRRVLRGNFDPLDPSTGDPADDKNDRK